MLADEDSVQRPDDAVPTAEDPSTAITTAEVLECKIKDLQAAAQRYGSSMDVVRDCLYAERVFLAERGACFMRDEIEKEFHEVKKTLAEEHEELPFRNLASADVQDEITATCNGPNPYNYPALSSEPSAIRLVVLLPSIERHADIVCELCNSALTKLVSDGYEALSYVWGDPTRRRPIIVSRQLFQVTENLEAALRYLRYPTKPRVLWIDTVCINQNNIQERNEQVQLMGHIYRCARRVVVWLGPESDTSGAAFQLMHNKPDVPDFAGAGPQEIQGFWTSFMPGLLGFFRLIRRPWFSRVWCIQELVLARAVDFQCGQHCATLNDFLWMQAMTVERRLLFTVSRVTRSELGGDDMTESISSFMKLAYLHYNLLIIGVPGITPNVKNSGSALDLLKIFRNWQCSNDKDRIFAFYGLVAPGCSDRDALRPNYSLSIAQVYIRFAVRYLQQHKNLDILITATNQKLGFIDISTTRELPSWVPDWRGVPRDKTCETYSTISTCNVESIRNPLFMQHNTIYNACLDLQVSPLRFLGDFRTLCLDGVAVDKVEEIGPPFLKYKQRYPQRLQMLLTWKAIAAPSIERDYPYTGESSYEAFWRTLQADSQLLDMPTKEDVAYLLKHQELPSMERFDKSGPRRFRIPPGASDFLPAASDFLPADGDDMRRLATLTYLSGPTVGRRFFKTAKGLIGLCPASARVADEVVVLFGGTAPFVLRPDGESHRVMGESYVHGIMDGEAIHQPRRREFTDLTTKEFHLI